MKWRNARAAVLGIWSLIAAFAVVQVITWTAAGTFPQAPAARLEIAGGWLVMLVLGVLSTRRIGGLTRTITRHEDAHTAVLDEVRQLQLSNAVLQVIARSVDVPLAFQALAQRIVPLVECDRVGLALLSADGQEFQTYTARVHDDERRVRPRPDVVFKAERTAIGAVVRSREPLIINDTSEGAPDFLDVNVLHTAGLGSALVVPLVTKGRAVGTLNVVSRKTGGFEPKHIEILQPIAEIFAVAYVAQQLQIAVGKYRTMEAMSELTLSIGADMNSALQTIIGQCSLMERAYLEPDLQRDLATVTYQAQRIAGLLDKMRAAANERMQEVADTVNQAGIPSSPEAYGDREPAGRRT